MADLLKLDGCAHYNTTDAVRKKWDTTGVGFSYSNLSPRRPGIGHLRCGYGYTHECGVHIPSIYDGIIVGSAFRLNTSLATGQVAGMYIIKTLGDISQIYCTVVAGGKLRIGLNNPGDSAHVIATETVGSITTGNWHYVEFKVYFKLTVGIVTVHLNNQEIFGVATPVLYTGTDIHPTYVGLLGGQQLVDYTDIYIRGTDSTIAFDIDRLGDCRVDTLYPVANSSVIELTSSTGADNYTCVDDTHVGDDSDYVYGNVTSRDMYEFSSLPVIGVSEIHGVAVTVAARTSELGGIRRINGICLGARSSRYYAVANTEYTFFQFAFTQCPTYPVESWTEEKVNGSTYGVSIYA